MMCELKRITARLIARSLLKQTYDDVWAEIYYTILQGAFQREHGRFWGKIKMMYNHDGDIQKEQLRIRF